jgi:hypothetical protein
MPAPWYTTRLFVRCWMPDDATGDGSYPPWVLGHPDEAALSDEQLTRLARQFAGGGGLDGYLDPDAFQSWLEAEHGYVAFPTAAQAGMLVLDVGGWEELEDGLGPDELRPIWPGLGGPSAAGLDRAIATAWAARDAATAVLIQRTLQHLARDVAAAAPTAARLHFCVREADEPGHLDGLGVARLTDQTGVEVCPLGGVDALEEAVLDDLATLAGVAFVDPDVQVLELTCEPPTLAPAEQTASPIDRSSQEGSGHARDHR